MINARNIVAAALVAIPGFVTAQGFEGAQLSASHTLTPSDRSFGATSYAGGIQIGLFSGISVELDFAVHDWRGFSGKGRAVTLHGLYELFPETVVGVYAAEQNLSSLGKITTWGIEGTTQMGALGLEGYLGRYDSGARTGSTLGVDVSYALGDAFSLTAGASSIDATTHIATYSVGGEYQFGNGPVVFADIGRQSSDGSSGTFVSLGARIDLGSGITFGSRSIPDMIPTRAVELP